jgi:hypothetical protein
VRRWEKGGGEREEGAPSRCQRYDCLMAGFLPWGLLSSAFSLVRTHLAQLLPLKPSAQIDVKVGLSKLPVLHAAVQLAYCCRPQLWWLPRWRVCWQGRHAWEQHQQMQQQQHCCRWAGCHAGDGLHTPWASDPKPVVIYKCDVCMRTRECSGASLPL